MWWWLWCGGGSGIFSSEVLCVCVRVHGAIHRPADPRTDLLAAGADAEDDKEVDGPDARVDGVAAVVEHLRVHICVWFVSESHDGHEQLQAPPPTHPPPVPRTMPSALDMPVRRACFPSMLSSVW